MHKSSIIKCLLSVIILMYLAFALPLTSSMAAHDTCSGVVINVVDSTKRGFVNARDIALEMGPVYENIRNITFDSLNTYAIEKQIGKKDNIERVNCHVLNNRTLQVDVTPLIPVARVFEKEGGNYYINRAGKHMHASPQYSMNVPVVIGSFNGKVTPQITFPIIDYLDRHKEWAELTSAIVVERNSDLILVPKIKGHVVNLGDTTDLENKFDRLRSFYHKVMPMKGWEYYDTLSVKWRGQIVAKQRNAKTRVPTLAIEEHDDIDDAETMDISTTPQPHE